jgi:hypothetical protein
MPALHVLCVASLACLLLSIAPVSLPEAKGTAAAGCPVTSPNERGLPGEPAPQGNHGDGSSLSTALWPGGRVTFKPGGPGCVARDGSLLMKWPWWRGIRGQLAVDGRSLDGSSGVVRAAILPYGETGFQASALVFPGPGCWEVSGHVGEATLSFVVLVEKVAEGPSSRCEALFPAEALRSLK